MPAVAVHDDAPGVAKAGLVEAGGDFGECCGFGGAALLIEPFQLSGEVVGAGGVAGGEEFDDLGGNVHASGGIDAGREAESDIDGRERAASRVDLGLPHQRS